MLVKGRSNYLSLRRLRVAQQRMLTLTPDRTAADQLVQIGHWSRQTPGRQPERPGRSAAPRRSGTWSRATAATAWAASAPTTRSASTSRPAGAFTGRTSSSSTTPCSSATWPCAASGPGSCPTTRSSSSTRPTRSKTWPPTTSACRSRRAGVEYLFNQLLAPRSTRGCSRPTATTQADRPARTRPAGGRAVLPVGPDVAAISRPAGPAASASRASCPTCCPRS